MGARPTRAVKRRVRVARETPVREAAATRVRVLGRAADERELVVPAHFRGAGAAEVRREGGKFAVSRWAA
ncbi:hypothetical protein [Streptomyces huasconensis]|uniref:hypothetical protein n=1 Tax=Streptomyces huasconensis TaxID=1854574 RepID=UPI00371040E4